MKSGLRDPWLLKRSFRFLRRVLNGVVNEDVFDKEEKEAREMIEVEGERRIQSGKEREVKMVLKSRSTSTKKKVPTRSIQSSRSSA